MISYAQPQTRPVTQYSTIEHVRWLVQLTTAGFNCCTQLNSFALVRLSKSMTERQLSLFSVFLNVTPIPSAKASSIDSLGWCWESGAPLEDRRPACQAAGTAQAPKGPLTEPIATVWFPSPPQRRSKRPSHLLASPFYPINMWYAATHTPDTRASPGRLGKEAVQIHPVDGTITPHNRTPPYWLWSGHTNQRRGRSGLT